MNKKTAFTRILDKSLQGKLERFEKELANCGKHFTEKATHSLRISLRRLISTLDVASSALGMVKTSKSRKLLKKSLDLFGELRDLQVKSLEAKKLKTRWPDMAPYAALLKDKEKEMIARIGSAAKKIKVPKIKKGIRPAFKKMRGAPAQEFRQEMYFAEAIYYVDARHNNAVAKARKVDRKSIKSIHELRLAFKKFRYSVEALAQILGGVTPEKLKEMRRFQQLMGEINDIHSILADITSWAKTREGKLASHEGAISELKARYKALLDDLMGRLSEVDRFWAGYVAESEKGK